MVDFNIAGDDPFTNIPVPAYAVTPVGAKPIIVVVSPNLIGYTGINEGTDINTFTLSLFLQGVLGRNRDLFGPQGEFPITTLIPEPLSGAYNTMEFSVPNSSQFHGSQDQDNCNGSTVYRNPLELQSTDSVLYAFRKRVVGTTEMIRELGSATLSGTLGYFFWSSAIAAKFYTTGSGTNAKYLTVNGVDPLQDRYTDGVLPGVDSAHPFSNVTFKWLNMGDYPIWSVMRFVSNTPTPSGVTNLVAAAEALNLTQHNFIPMSSLNVWHSYFFLPAINQGIQANGTTINPATPGDLCNAPGALPEFGGDAGGATVLKQNNANFCSDFGNQNGLVNRTN